MNVFRSRYRRASLGLRRALFPSPLETDDLAAVETRDEVVRMLRGLDPNQRAAVVLASILDHWAEEAGRMLGLSASSVRSLTTRARARMKHEVRSEVISTGLFEHRLDLNIEHGPSVFGTISVRDGERLVRFDWHGPDFPREGAAVAMPEQVRALERLDALLTDPAS